MNPPQQPAEKLRSPQVPRSVVVLTIIVLASLALVAVFANIQRLRRGQFETLVVLPASFEPRRSRANFHLTRGRPVGLFVRN